MKKLTYLIPLIVLLAGCSGTSRMQAKAMKNPVEPTPESVTAGKISYFSSQK